jgi:hypothetical protein
MGVVGTAVTTLRLWKVTVIYQLYGKDTNSPRWFIEMANVVLLSQIEVSIIIVCANLPGLAAWLKRSLGSRSGSGGRRGSTRSRTLSCSLSCGLSSCGKGSCSSSGGGTNSRIGGNAGAAAGGRRAGGGAGCGSGRHHGLFRHLRWWGRARQEAPAANRNSRGSYSYRLKALRAPERSFTRSAQDAATACDSESVKNFVVVTHDEADAPPAPTAPLPTQRDDGPWQQRRRQSLQQRQQQQQQQQTSRRRQPVPFALPLAPHEEEPAGRRQGQAPRRVPTAQAPMPASVARRTDENGDEDNVSVVDGDDDEDDDDEDNIEQVGPASVHEA